MAGVMQLAIKDYGDTITPWQERWVDLRKIENSIRKDLAKMQECCVYIGYHLLDIERQNLYSLVCCEGTGDYCKNIYQYALQELDLAKTTTFNLMAVAKMFGDEFRGLRKEYREYSFSQLVELLSFPKEFLPYAMPSMSVKKLRQLKKGEMVLYEDEDGYTKFCTIPQKVLQSVKADVPSTMTVTVEKVEPVYALSQGTNRSDVGTEENAQVLTQGLDHSDVGTAETIASQNPPSTLNKECAAFADEIEFTRWFYDNYNKTEIYPLIVCYYTK